MGDITHALLTFRELTFTNKTSVSPKHLSHIMLQQGSSAKKDHQRKHRFIKLSFSGIPLELFANKQKAICNCHNMNTNHSFIMGILVGTSFPLPVESWTANFVQYYIDLHCHLHRTSSHHYIFIGCIWLRGIHWSPVNSPQKGHWRAALMFSLICDRINGWVNNRESGDLIRHRAHCDVIVVLMFVCCHY